MPARRNKANPFWAQAVKEKIHQVYSFVQRFLTCGRNGSRLSGVKPTVGVLLLPPAMTPNLCIDKKIWFGTPRWVVSFPSIGIEQVHSKQNFFEPSDVQASLRCEMLVATAAATHTHAIYDHGFTPAACAKARTRAFQRWKISSHPRDQWRSDGGVTIDRQRFRKRTSSAPSCFLYRVRPPPKQSTADTQALKYISLAHIEIVFCVAISDDLRAYV